MYYKLFSIFPMRLFANAYKRELYSKGGCGDTMYIIYCGVEHKGNQLTALHPLHLDPTRGLLQFPRAQNISPLGQQIHLGSVFGGILWIFCTEMQMVRF